MRSIPPMLEAVLTSMIDVTPGRILLPPVLTVSARGTPELQRSMRYVGVGCQGRVGGCVGSPISASRLLKSSARALWLLAAACTLTTQSTLPERHPNLYLETFAMPYPDAIRRAIDCSDD